MAASGVDAAGLPSLLRRLSEARPGAGVLYLPAGMTSQAALRAIQDALRALEPVPAPEARLPESVGSARIHIDGAARGNPGPAGVGVLVLGADGRVLERLGSSIGEATNNVAEYRALLLALERAQTLGCDDIKVYSDSELLVRQLQGRYQVKHPMLLRLYKAARTRIAGFRRFSIHHVPREQNADADALANRAIEEACRPGRGKGKSALSFSEEGEGG